MHSVSVAAVTRRDDGRVLCIQRRDTGAWQIPGGVLERGETLQDGLRREVREETGGLVEPVRLTGVYLNLPMGVVAMVFLCRAASAVISPQSEESAAVDWLTVDEIVQRSVPAFAVRVTDALAGRPEPFLRHHDGVQLLGVAGAPGAGGGSGSAADS